MADHTFCRMMYKNMVAEMKAKKPDFKPRHYWTYKYSDGRNYEVQNPEAGFYWYGQAHCAWDAKFKAFIKIWDTWYPGEDVNG